MSIYSHHAWEGILGGEKTSCDPESIVAEALFWDIISSTTPHSAEGNKEMMLFYLCYG